MVYGKSQLSENPEFDATKDDPKDWIRLHQQLILAHGHVTAERYSKAETISRQILAERPDCVLNYFALGTIACGQSEIGESITYYREFLSRIDKMRRDGLENETLHHLSQYVHKAYNGLGMAFLQMKDYTQAAKHCNKALYHNPDMVEARYNLGNTCYAQNKIDKAVEHYTKALDLDPNLIEAHYNLGNALVKQCKFDAAITHYKKAIQLRPDWPEPFNQLAMLKVLHKNEKVYNPEEAILLARYACKLTNYKDGRLLNILSLGYAAAERFSEAIETAQKALEIAESAGLEKLAAAIRVNLRSYQQDQSPP